MYLIDSYALVEYFKGSAEGKRASQYIESGNSSTTTMTIAELAEKYEREKLDFKEDLKFILSRIELIDLNFKIALIAGKINATRKKLVKDWGMADSIILATANFFGIKVITGDEHFKDIKEVIMIN